MGLWATWSSGRWPGWLGNRWSLKSLLTESIQWFSFPWLVVILGFQTAQSFSDYLWRLSETVEVVLQWKVTWERAQVCSDKSASGNRLRKYVPVPRELCPKSSGKILNILYSHVGLFVPEGFCYYFWAEVNSIVREENNFSGMIFSRKSIQCFWKL